MEPFSFLTRVRWMTLPAKVLGIWPMDNSWYFWYSIIISLSYNLYLLARIVFFFFIDSVEELAAAGLLAVPELATNAKVYFILKNHDKYRQLYSELDGRFFQPKNERQHQIAHKFYQTFDRMHAFLRFVCSTCLLLFGVWALVDTKDGRKLPYLAWYFYDWTKSPYYEITFIHQIVSIELMAHIHLTIDFLTIYVLSVITIQFKFLADEVVHCTTDEELVGCIKHHQEILQFFKRMYELLNGIMIVQFSFNAISICFTLSQLTAVEITSAEFLAVLAYQVAILSECFIYCWWGNEVMIESQEVSRAAFECKWIDRSVKFKKNLAFFLHRTQTPTILCTANFFKINLDAYKAIIRLSYSVFAVLRHFRENK